MIDLCMPNFNHKGRILPGAVTMLAHLRDMSNSCDAMAFVPRLARFQQHLLPHALATRALSVWMESLSNANPHQNIPDDLDLQKAALAGLINDALDQRWAMIKDAHLCYSLYRLYKRLVERALANIPAASGNISSRAKKAARLELVAAIHGEQLPAPDKIKYGEMLRVRLHYGKELRMLIRYMETRMPEDPEMAFLVLAVFRSRSS
jgi:hypothetical protein